MGSTDGPVATGRRGEIHLHERDDGSRIATKRAKSQATKAALIKEKQLLHYLDEQMVGFVPIILEESDDSFSYQWIDGQHFDTAYQQADPATKKQLMHRLLERAHQLDQLSVVHGELHHPTKNVLVDDQQNIRIIDFGSGRFGDSSGKNMRHLAQRLARKQVIDHASCKQLGQYTPQEIYQLLKEQIAKREAPQKSRIWSWSPRQFRGSISLLIGVDQLSKYLFVSLQRGSDFWLFTPAINPGSGWSMPVPLVIVLGITIAVLVFVAISFIKRWYHPVLLGLMAAGALGNGIDRIWFGRVRDFIDLHYRPIFNFADIYLTAAALFLFYQIIRKKQRRSSQ